MANRQEKIFYAVDTETSYNKNGTEYSNRELPYIFTKEKVDYTIQLCTAFNSIDDFQEYTDFTGQTITPSAVIDNDFDHVDSGTLVTGVSGAITEIEIQGLTNPPLQTGFIQLVNAADESETVEYTAVTTGGTGLLFTVSTTLTYSYDAGDESNVNDPALIKTSDIDQTDKDTGLFVVTFDANSRPYIRAIKGKSNLTIGTTEFELQVRDSDGDLSFVARFDIQCKNIMDDDGVIPPPENGNYYTKPETDALLGGKMDKVPTAVTGNIPEFNALGEVIDSGFKFADFGLDLTSQSTALLTMTGTTTIGATTGTVVLPSITGEIIDIDTGNKYQVSYTGGSEVAITNPENIITLFAIDKDNNLLQKQVPVDCVDARDYVYFSAASTLDGVNVDAVADNVATTPYAPALSISDLWDTLGALGNNRDVLSPNGANLSINVSELDLWFTAINFKDKKCPNKKTIASQSAPTLTRVWRDGAGFWSTDQSTSLDPTEWDDGDGTPATLTQDQFQNLTFFIGPQDGAIFYFLGQEIYSSRAGALASVNQDRERLAIETFPRTLFYIGTIVVRNDALQLNDPAQAVFSEGQEVAKVFDNIVALGDGLIQNDVSVTFTHNGINSQLVLTADNEDFIELQLDGVPLEMASPSSINLIHGTATNPTQNFVYITAVGSTPTLQVSQTQPTVPGVGLYANVWNGLVQDATGLQTTQKFKATQEVIDYFKASQQSWIRTANNKHRANTTYESGLVTTLTPDVGGQAAVIDWAVTSGVVSQLSPHDVDAFDSTIDTYEVPNDFTTPYVAYNGLEEITTDINGSSFATNNRQWNLILWVAVGEVGSDAKFYVNPPDGFYSNDSVNAINDTLNTAITAFPTGFKGKGQLIGRVTLQFNSGLYTVLNFEDLREAAVSGGGSGGGGASAFTELSDTPSSYTGFENYTVKVNAGGTGLEFVATGAGESNTISNVGTEGAELADGKVGVDLQMRRLNSTTSAMTIVADVANKKVDATFIPGNVTHESIGSLQGGTTGEYYHLTAAEYSALGASAPLWSTKNTFLSSFTINNATDQNKWFSLGDTAAAERTITTDPNAGDKFNFWVDSENADYDVVVSGAKNEIVNYLSATGDFVRMASDAAHGQAQCLTVASDFNTVTFKLKKGLSPTGNVAFRVYALTGSIEVDAYPTGSVLAEGFYDSSLLTTSYTEIEVILNNTLASGSYGISVEFEGTAQATGYVDVEASNTDIFSGNRAVLPVTDVWAYHNNLDLSVKLSQTDTIAGESTYTVSRTNKGVTQFVKDGSDYKVLYDEPVSGGGGGASVWGTETSKSADYTILSTDAGNLLYLDSTDTAERTFTFDAGFPDKGVVWLYNDNATYRLIVNDGTDDILFLFKSDKIYRLTKSTSEA
jgi:hypothetical protein